MIDETTIDLLQIKIERAKENLTGEAKLAIGSVDWRKVIAGLKEKKGYNAEQMEALELETELVLSGLVDPDTYPQHLQSQMKISKPQTDILLEELNDLIFEKIKKELVELTSKKIPQKRSIDIPKRKVSLEGEIKQQNLVTQEPDPRFANLPAKVKKVIEDSNYGPKIYILGKEQGLTLAQITNLEEIVTDTIVGTTAPEMFEVRAMSISGLNPDKLKLLVSDINTKILKEIREQILNLEHEGNSATPPAEKTQEIVVESPKQTQPEPNTVLIDALTPINLVVTNKSEVSNKQADIVTTLTPPAVPTTSSSIGSIAFKKLAGAFKAPAAETKYSLNNKPETAGDSGTSSKNSQTVDPYRMPIE